MAAAIWVEFFGTGCHRKGSPVSQSLVILIDCPFSVPRLWPVARTDFQSKVKILQGNGYEHFEFIGEYVEVCGILTPIYRWRHRTFIAE
ncbi:DUF5988 family protein [Streptomyces sp. 6N223]|uniref:DUF5988 family protein n=1 Tax=Streptomyces sp. 6N223 TaxID=3457412 RepID=UPI003FD55251